MIKLCLDGKYRWYYEYPMLKNPVILFTIWKVMLIAALFPALVVFLSGLPDGFICAGKECIAVYGITYGVVFALSCIAYFIISAIYGFKYIVLFEMDDKEASHIQQSRQFKKAQAMAWLETAAGALEGSFTAIGTGILSGTKQKMTSEFKNVKMVIGIKSRGTIKLNQTFAKNQVYVKQDDYDFVWEYITSRCINAEIKERGM